ncbi:glycerol-3-phosphate 1-O-acyltransferase PlsY [Mycoplasma sp. NEAQ87857]|uniref:glycerol-3-phosphate 1-O-acyltransferase PlsY n=1 Tax=Mycoplasma sp. NEAQ87857 TaxID=2683967 RepID=UPI0013185BA1|nr:glycerol-3-phosphate 1-O-acyltransferase PlsY [Mycoplasma sp. NEAQ87857]QGZ97402.1 glycerol-3-phosphate 1-O-acyltransferase PlsY [Mycoplasma sp. NEAQ87857]
MIYSIFINIAFLIFGYLIGSINFAILIGHKTKQLDVRDYHSKNAGATNSTRVLGKKLGLIILILDILKALIPVLIVRSLIYAFPIGEYLFYLFPIITGFGVVVGHIYPVFFKFKGGKGVACCVGVLIAINSLLLLIAAVFFFGIIFLFKYVSLASISTAVIMTIFVFIPWFSSSILGWTTINPSLFYVNGIFYILSAALLIYSHRSNIIRLINHQERKIKF